MFLFQDTVDPKDIETISLAAVPESNPSDPVGSVSEIAAIAGTSSSPDISLGLFSPKNIDSDEELDLLNDMIQTSQFHHPHHRAFQVRFVISYSNKRKIVIFFSLIRGFLKTILTWVFPVNIGSPNCIRGCSWINDFLFEPLSVLP